MFQQFSLTQKFSPQKGNKMTEVPWRRGAVAIAKDPGSSLA
jgi:hypothetical protein